MSIELDADLVKDIQGARIETERSLLPSLLIYEMLFQGKPTVTLFTGPRRGLADHGIGWETKSMQEYSQGSDL